MIFHATSSFFIILSLMFAVSGFWGMLHYIVNQKEYLQIFSEKKYKIELAFNTLWLLFWSVVSFFCMTSGSMDF